MYFLINQIHLDFKHLFQQRNGTFNPHRYHQSPLAITAEPGLLGPKYLIVPFSCQLKLLIKSPLFQPLCSLQVYCCSMLGAPKRQGKLRTLEPSQEPQRQWEVLLDIQRTAENQGQVLKGSGVFLGNSFWSEEISDCPTDAFSCPFHPVLLFTYPSTQPPLPPTSPTFLASITTVPLFTGPLLSKKFIIRGEKKKKKYL